MNLFRLTNFFSLLRCLCHACVWWTHNWAMQPFQNLSGCEILVGFVAGTISQRYLIARLQWICQLSYCLDLQLIGSFYNKHDTADILLWLVMLACWLPLAGGLLSVGSYSFLFFFALPWCVLLLFFRDSLLFIASPWFRCCIAPRHVGLCCIHFCDCPGCCETLAKCCYWVAQACRCRPRKSQANFICARSTLRKRAASGKAEGDFPSLEIGGMLLPITSMTMSSRFNCLKEKCALRIAICVCGCVDSLVVALFCCDCKKGHFNICRFHATFLQWTSLFVTDKVGKSVCNKCVSKTIATNSQSTSRLGSTSGEQPATVTIAMRSCLKCWLGELNWLPSGFAA